MVFGINTDNTKIQLICNSCVILEKIAVELEKKYKFKHIKTHYNSVYDITATCNIYNLDEENELIAKLARDFKDDLTQIGFESR